LGKPFVGILIHPWDIQDEGSFGVAETLSGLGVSSLFLAVNATAEEHPPQPVDARLTHNPKRKRFVSEEGRFYYETDSSFYPNSVAIPKRSAEERLMGYDVFVDTREAFSASDLSRYVWLTSLHNGQFIEDGRELATVDITSDADRNWMCPNNPNVLIQMLELINEIQTKYDTKGILLDNFWWKYPHTFMSSLESGMVCFCEHCLEGMDRAGIDTRKLRVALSGIARAVRGLTESQILDIRDTDPDQLLRIVGLEPREGAGYADIMNALFEDRDLRGRIPELAETDGLGIFSWLNEHPIILDWLDFKADVLRELLHSIRSLVKSNDRDFELGLAIWSPRSSWSVCQRYGDLVQECDWMMPMVYHKIWGWYSTCVADELFQITHPKTPTMFASYKEILRAWYKLAGYSGSHLASHVINGLSPEQIRKELERSRELVGGGYPLYAGIQLWEPGSKIPHPEEAAEIARICLESDIQGILIQGYGWTPMPNLIAFSKAMEDFTRTQP
jgi:hypothetical protein